MNPLDEVAVIAKKAGDPMPSHKGGPDSCEFIEWHERWRSVERALKIAQAANRMADAIRSTYPPLYSELNRALADFDHQLIMFVRGY